VKTTSGLTSVRSREDLVPLLPYSGDQLIERGGECLDGIRLQLLGDRVHVKAERRHSRQYGVHFFSLCPERDPNASVISKRIERRGRIGTAVAQQHLRSILAFCNSPLMNSIEAYIQFEDGLISEDGTVSNESMNKFLRNYMAEFHGFIARVYTVLPRNA
jgi:hypothetical protein